MKSAKMIEAGRKAAATRRARKAAQMNASPVANTNTESKADVIRWTIEANGTTYTGEGEAVDLNRAAASISGIAVQESRATITNMHDAVAILSSLVAGKDREHYAAAYLDNSGKVIGAEIIGIGIIDSALVGMSETFRSAIRKNAASIVVAHNHPSGNTTPSNADLSVTAKLVTAGKVLGIRVLDHLVIGNGYRSIMQ